MWLDEDIEAALEWIEYERSLCSGCSQPRSEAFNPHGPDYEAQAWRCHACEARDNEIQKWRNDKSSDLAGIHFVVSEVPD